jgi:hypothetical protein
MDAALWILLAQYLISNCVALDSITAREAANTTIPAALVIPPSQYLYAPQSEANAELLTTPPAKETTGHGALSICGLGHQSKMFES